MGVRRPVAPCKVAREDGSGHTDSGKERKGLMAQAEAGTAGWLWASADSSDRWTGLSPQTPWLLPDPNPKGWMLHVDNRSMLHMPAADRNKEAIGEALAHFWPFSEEARAHLEPEQTLGCLEIGSGTGQHVEHLAARFTHILWQPSEYRGDQTMHKVPKQWSGYFSHFNSIKARTEGLGNVLPPLELDAASREWPDTFEAKKFEAVFVANLLHTTVPAVMQGLANGAARVIAPGGGLFLYGAFKVDGEHLAPSNDAFDTALRWHNLGWGVREVANVSQTMAQEGLVLSDKVELPSFNMLLVFRKPAFGSQRADECAQQPLDTGDASGRRRLQSAMPSREEAWHAAWQRRLECWWLALPQPTQGLLGSCLGALGLHLGSRLESLVSRSRSKGLPTSAAAAERGCEWIKGAEAAGADLRLPAFPEVDFDFGLPPLPRLVPSWQRLHSLSTGGREGPPSPLAREQSGVEGDAARGGADGGPWAPLATGAGLGVGLAALSFLVLVSRSGRSGKNRAGRMALRLTGNGAASRSTAGRTAGRCASGAHAGRSQLEIINPSA